MPAICTLDGLDLNDRVLFFLLKGFDPGENPPTFDEHVKYNGTLSVRNVSRARVVEATLPLDVRGSSEAVMLAGVELVNVKLRLCTFATPRTLVVGSASYQIIDSAEARPVHDELYDLHVARLSLALNRLP